MQQRKIINKGAIISFINNLTQPINQPDSLRTRVISTVMADNLGHEECHMT